MSGKLSAEISGFEAVEAVMHMEAMIKGQAVDSVARWTPAALFGQGEAEAASAQGREMTCCGEILRPFWLEDGRFGAVCKKCGHQHTDNTQTRYGGSPWIGVDLDGTLARDLGSARWDEIGSPIEPMLMRVKRWIAEGHTVKIFTARASSPKQVLAIREWLASCGLPDLEVTNVKDLNMIELWDDRCVQVTTNLGEPISAKVQIRHRKPARSAREVEPSGFFSRLRVLLLTL